MERYSGTQAMEAMPADPVAEWAEAGGETGLEGELYFEFHLNLKPMWQLGLGGGAESYPERPDDPDCIYYLRTGFCGYGNRCRFNHPRDRSSAMGSLRTGGVDYPERIGQPVCQYYMRTGMCKFGTSCKYHHPKYGVGSSSPITLNFYGYPLKPGEKECSHYIRTGQCKFGLTCKYNHPQPAGVQAPPPGPGVPAPAPMPTHAVYPSLQSPSLQSSQQYGVVPGNWPVARPAILPGSYVPGSFGPMIFPPGVVPVPGWTPYQKHTVQAPVSHVVSPSTQPTVGAGPIYGITQLSPSSAAYAGPYASITSAAGGPSSIISHREYAFPERQGQPECQYYLRTGDCKFGSTCKYHHPREWTAPRTNFSLSPMGLPLRPGTPLCSHYAHSGVCTYGSSCKFDHPIGTLSYSPSASSLTDMPVAPYPVGSTNATLAPSSSSSDLRPELLSRPSNDTFSSQTSSMNSSSTSVGSTFSKSGPTPQSSVQHSGLGPASSS
ncbi:zinc finger CCCH domain-containing protein 32 [Phtheirospermum japonicum]|uniref:Zinc finger CCCH domain-containing protein 32 n=1 Tax=Phtheirospermum japonicum TaxID=374723 RepID=A0A830D7J6_9LAMI|nr:zinc finger CCCH domain-containing protein 32 [Phtheirospermum japonicum]